MRTKLGRRGYDEADVDAAVARLIELGYLDDRSFAAGHVRRRSGSRGPLALSAELFARGVDRLTTREAVAGYDSEAQLASAERLAARLAGGRLFARYKELLDRVGPKLVRRGFAPAVARAACDHLWNGTAGRAEA
jgi:regulatory protein